MRKQTRRSRCRSTIVLYIQHQGRWERYVQRIKLSDHILQWNLQFPLQRIPISGYPETHIDLIADTIGYGIILTS